MVQNFTHSYPQYDDMLIRDNYPYFLAIIIPSTVLFLFGTGLFFCCFGNFTIDINNKSNVIVDRKKRYNKKNIFNHIICILFTLALPFLLFYGLAHLFLLVDRWIYDYDHVTEVQEANIIYSLFFLGAFYILGFFAGMDLIIMNMVSIINTKLILGNWIDHVVSFVTSFIAHVFNFAWFLSYVMFYMFVIGKIYGGDEGEVVGCHDDCRAEHKKNKGWNNCYDEYKYVRCIQYNKTDRLDKFFKIFSIVSISLSIGFAIYYTCYIYDMKNEKKRSNKEEKKEESKAVESSEIV